MLVVLPKKRTAPPFVLSEERLSEREVGNPHVFLASFPKSNDTTSWFPFFGYFQEATLNPEPPSLYTSKAER